MTRLEYLGLLCKNSRTSVGYQYVAKKVIRRSALSVLQRQSYRMTWFGYQVVAKTVIQDDVLRLSRQSYRMTWFGYQYVTKTDDVVGSSL